MKKYGTLHFRWKDVRMTAKLFSLNQNKTTNELEIGHMVRERVRLLVRLGDAPKQSAQIGSYCSRVVEATRVFFC